MKILPALSFGLSRIVRLLFTPFRRAGRLFCLAYFGVLLSTWLALSLSVGKVGLTPLCLLFDAYILALVGTVGGRYVRYVLGAVVASVVHWGIASINGMAIASVCYLIGHFTSKKR